MKDIYLPKHNNNFTVEPELDKSAFIPTVGVNLDNVLCIQEDRVVQNDNTVRYNKLILQIPANKFRHHFVKANVKVNKYLNNTMAIFHGPMMIGEYDTKGNIIKEKEGKKKIAA